MVIAACVRRPIRFVMDHKIFRIPVLSFVFRAMRTIPIAPAREDAALKASGASLGVALHLLQEPMTVAVGGAASDARALHAPARA